MTDRKSRAKALAQDIINMIDSVVHHFDDFEMQMERTDDEKHVYVTITIDVEEKE